MEDRSINVRTIGAVSLSGYLARPLLTTSVEQAYTLVEFLGEGSTAHVYLAQSRSDDSAPPVAIKVIDKLLVQHTQLQRRIQQEMVLHAQLSHPHILQVQVRNAQWRLVDNRLIAVSAAANRMCLKTTAITTWCWSIANAALYRPFSKRSLGGDWAKQTPSISSARLAAFGISDSQEVSLTSPSCAGGGWSGLSACQRHHPSGPEARESACDCRLGRENLGLWPCSAHEVRPLDGMVLVCWSDSKALTNAAKST